MISIKEYAKAHANKKEAEMARKRVEEEVTKARAQAEQQEKAA